MDYNYKRIIFSILISFILYTLWIQYTVGNIWWRNNTFQPLQIITFFERPFNSYGHLWNIEVLDINPYIFIPIVSVIIYFLSKYII